MGRIFETMLLGRTCKKAENQNALSNCAAKKKILLNAPRNAGAQHYEIEETSRV